MPREIGSVLRIHQREGYRCLFDASAQSIRDVGAATKSLKGCQLGFFGVLHTWGRDPAVYHPHIHYVVPGGGVKLVVDIQAVGHGVPTLKYLAPYVHRVAINDSRILNVDAENVTYRIRREGNRIETKTVRGETFVENFLQHVLPTNFMKIRHYGWMSAGSKIKVEEVKWLVWIMLGWTFWLGSGYAPQAKPLTVPMKCRVCGGSIRVIEITYTSLSSMGIKPEHGLTYFDSG